METGDWNLVLNPEEDTETYRHVNNPAARTEVLKLIYLDFAKMSTVLLGDSSTQKKKQARLYFFLISEESFETYTE